jgi:pimeloyl-ACP methyl ester carboxylesterase
MKRDWKQRCQQLLTRRGFGLAALAVTLGAKRAMAEESAAEKALATEIEAMQYITSKTSGGKQFWADVWIFHDYRIQRHAITKHCRLLDGNNLRQASGSFEACREKLDEIRKRDNLPAMEGRAVIVLHGLFRHRGTMGKLRTALAAAEGYSVYCVGYPTTRGGVIDHAHSLDSAIRSLDGITEINFVAHSLGNLVVRHWLKDLADEGRTLPDGQKFGRMVMLAPPNHQPQLATKLVRGTLAEFVAGPAAQQLAKGWESLQPKLATPHFEFGILAGGRGDGRGYNPLIPGDDDAVITVESTRLPGARDFRLLPALHSVFMNDSKVQEYTVRFLNEGHFESNEKRQPIEKD